MKTIILILVLICGACDYACAKESEMFSDGRTYVLIIIVFGERETSTITQEFSSLTKCNYVLSTLREMRKKHERNIDIESDINLGACFEK